MIIERVWGGEFRFSSNVNNGGSIYNSEVAIDKAEDKKCLKLLALV